MGYGEFGGGGSVDWRVVHGNGRNGFGHIGGGHGHDNDPPKNSGGRFVVVVNGVVIADTWVDDGRILVLWGSHIEGPTPDKRNVKIVPPPDSSVPETGV